MPVKTAQAGLYYVKSGCSHLMRNRFFLPALAVNARLVVAHAGTPFAVRHNMENEHALLADEIGTR
jgi:hypothetical protein